MFGKFRIQILSKQNYTAISHFSTFVQLAHLFTVTSE